MDARLQLSEFEWLDQIVVSTAVKTSHTIVQLVARGNHEYRHDVARLA